MQEHGPNLGRPIVDRIEGSRIHNLKELRVKSDGELRILLVFDPWRTAVLLLGGDKTGQWKEWYPAAISQAEQLYADYLEGLSR
ncbi:MAG: type II toxin-antitoxin system RelE/ParE family toxin [Acidimicrobiia bacterium]